MNPTSSLELGSVSVQLWTVGNYHWYLKQSLDFGADPQRALVSVCWNPERPLRLHVVTRSWTCITYDWSWTTDRSAGPDAADNASVAVIDGGEHQSDGSLRNHPILTNIRPPR